MEHPPLVTDSYCYLEFQGPSVLDGSISALDLSRAIAALDRILNKLARNNSNLRESPPELRVSATGHSSFEVYLIVGGVVYLSGIALREFAKSFFSTVGEQLALRMFKKNSDVRIVGPPKKVDDDILLEIENGDGERTASTELALRMLNTASLSSELQDITYSLRNGYVETIKFGYKHGRDSKVVTITPEDRAYFFREPEVDDVLTLESLTADGEPFSGLTGKFIEYHTTADKYPFKFQPNSQTKKFGRKGIPCSLRDEMLRDACIDLLKPRIGEIVISGIAYRSGGGAFGLLRIHSAYPAKAPDLFDTE